MMWHVVLRFAPSLSLKFREAFQEYRKSVSGVAGSDPRWQDCLGVVDSSFGMPFGLLFVDEAFEGESKKSVRNATELPSSILGGGLCEYSFYREIGRFILMVQPSLFEC